MCRVRVGRGAETLFTQRVVLTEGRTAEVLAVWSTPGGGATADGDGDQDGDANLAQGRRLADDGEGVGAVGFIGDGRRVVSGGDGGRLRFRDLDDGHDGPLAARHGTILGLSTFDGGRRVLSAAGDGVLRVWDTGTGDQVGALTTGEGAKVCAVTTTPDGRVAAAAFESGGVRVFDLARERQVIRLDVAPAAVGSLALTPDGRTALVGTVGRTRGSNPVEVRDVATGRRVRRLTGHAGPVWGVACLPDGRRAASVGGDSTLRVWDLTTGRELQRFDRHPGAARCLALSADGRFALVGTGHRWADGWSPAERYGVQVWDLQEGRYVGRFDTEGPVNSVALSPDGRLAVAASADRVVEVWEMPVPSVRASAASVAAQPSPRIEFPENDPTPARDVSGRGAGSWTPG